jgi:putative ABC transport system substrate-binding protein
MSIRTIRRLTAAVALSILMAPPLVHAQQHSEPRRIGYLGDRPAPAGEAFDEGLRELGWIQGQNIIVEYRYSEGDDARLPSLAEELVQLGLEVIVAPDSFYVEAAQRATSTIPIVFCVHGDPVMLRHVASLARPGGNITGLASPGPELLIKQLALLKETVPAADRIAWLRPLTLQSYTQTPQAVSEAAVGLGIELTIVQVGKAEELEAAFAALAQQGTDALIVAGSPLTYLQRERVAELALRHRLPSITSFQESTKAGALMSYAPDINDRFRRCAGYVDKILKGAKPAELPVERASKFEFFINLKTAKALGLTIPQSVLTLADEVID